MVRKSSGVVPTVLPRRGAFLMNQDARRRELNGIACLFASGTS
jgi:hypothetical protein